ncbi:VanZ family protein [Parvularcula sp. LCG005]|uniref:VanZ family protein n=1 Tax=Parvularcula sp. LCG005 TaxID=3078805 RepID=UPI0029430817|nr:VanZ family protein [Parvularcula sp. LCG005]WOI54821.1 VanZ family protein [Parvularcula sp. LCG005]
MILTLLYVQLSTGNENRGSQSDMSYAQFWRINAVVILVLVTIVSLTPDPEKIGKVMDWSAWIAALVLGDPMSGDKVSHFMAYGALGFFSTLGFTTAKRQAGLVFLALLGYGLLMEVCQGMFTSTRTSDALDFLANNLGALSGILGALVVRALVQHYGIHIRTPVIR